MSIDFRGLADRLLARGPALLQTWFPNGRLRGHEFQIGSIRGEPGTSLSINVNTGRWADFATGESGGDLISLYAAAHGLSQADAARELGAEETRQPVRAEPVSRPPPAAARAVIMPAPQPCQSFDHPRYGKPVHVWAYDDVDGRLLGYVARYEPAGERKQIVPWTCAADGWGMGQWPEPRPLYGLSRFRTCEQAVLLVEGEKAADAAQKTVGNVYAVLTWPGGSQAWRKADWRPLHGRKILLWPDNDGPGISCMEAIGAHLLAHCPEVKLIDPRGQPLGWDAADAGFTWNEFKAWAVPRARVLEPADDEPGPARDLETPATAGPPDEPPPGTPPAAPDTGPPDDGDVPIEVNTDLLLPDTNSRGKPLATIENLAEIVNRLGVTLRYNVISKEEEILIPGQSFTVDNGANASLAWLQSWCARFGMPTDRLSDFVTYLADRNQYNPVAEWILSKPWDRTHRLPWLYATIQAAGEAGDPTIRTLKETMIRRWMISAVAAAFEPDGVAAGGMLVLQGPQYLGKTKWFLDLVPSGMGFAQDGMMLRPDDRDSVKQVCSFWIVELGELDATFRKSDIAALKAFITRKQDVLRRAYARKESHYARRTVFFGSVNPRWFLADPTGNRRYWTIPCEAIDHSHGLDMQQVWAEVHAIYREWVEAGRQSLAPWLMEACEVEELNTHNEQFENIDPVAERIESRLDWEAKETFWSWRRVTDILIEVGVDRPTASDAAKAGLTLTKRGCKRRKTNGSQLVLAPAPVKSVQAHPRYPDD